MNYTAAAFNLCSGDVGKGVTELYVQLKLVVYSYEIVANQTITLIQGH